MSPTFEYACEACGVVTEEFHSISLRPDFISCSKCGKPAQRQVSVGEGFHLKGMSWARDGYTNRKSSKE